ncbi:hypothetical protein K8T06_12965 [bacterium]|nr:hypothetical protein [bacterium]
MKGTGYPVSGLVDLDLDRYYPINSFKTQRFLKSIPRLPFVKEGAGTLLWIVVYPVSVDFYRKTIVVVWLVNPFPSCGHLSPLLRNRARKYLKSITLSFKPYSKFREGMDHDHCVFCYAKFMDSDASDVLREDYATQDDYHWVCLQCFKDFKEIFEWTVVF